MRSATTLRSAASTALAVAAKAMAVGSRAVDRVAGLVRPEAASPDGGGRGRPEPTPSPDPARGAVRTPPTEHVPQVPTHTRTYETHVEELAAGTAAEVLAVIPELSTDELGRLYEHELANKKRKTVLASVERATDPRLPDEPAPEPMSEAGGVPTSGSSTPRGGGS